MSSKAVTFKNTTHTRLFSNKGYKNNNTLKNTKTGHPTVEAKYNAEKGRLNALTKKKWRSMFTPVWMKLYKDITEKNARFSMNTDEANKVEADLYGILRSTAKGRAKIISQMNATNAEKENAAEKFVAEFIERASTLTYDRVLQHVKEEQEKRTKRLAAAAELEAVARATASKPANLNRLSGKKRQGVSLNKQNNNQTKKGRL